jgi:dephospho-CoA kinase
LARHGAYLIDADVVAREVVEPESPGLRAIVDHFGPTILTAGGQLDRAALADVVFHNAGKLEVLNSIVHPLVRRQIDQRLDELRPTADFVLLSVPLMIESGHYRYDWLIAVDVPEEVAVARLVSQRGWTAEQAWSRVRSQTSRDERRRVANDVLDNSGSLEQLNDRVEQLWSMITARVRERR